MKKFHLLVFLFLLLLSSCAMQFGRSKPQDIELPGLSIQYVTYAEWKEIAARCNEETSLLMDQTCGVFFSHGKYYSSQIIINEFCWGNREVSRHEFGHYIFDLMGDEEKKKMLARICKDDSGLIGCEELSSLNEKERSELFVQGYLQGLY